MPLRASSFQTLINHLPEEIYRVKGFLHLAEQQNNRTLLQKVGHRVTLTQSKAWDGPPQTWLGFIGAKGAINHEALERELDACQVV